jgi:hypothetical protein
MSDQAPYPYILEIISAKKPAGHFQFAIRKHGKMLQRSDRAYPTEEEAHKRGLAEIEKQLHGTGDRR